MSILTATAKFTPGDTRRALDLYIQVKIFSAVQAGQNIVRDEARMNCPVLTGELAGSIHVVEPVNTGKQIVGSVAADAPHAAFVEFGTGIRGHGTYPYPLPQEGVPITGHWQYDYRNRNWKGMPAHPFMRPALDTARDRVLSEFKS